MLHAAIQKRDFEKAEQLIRSDAAPKLLNEINGAGSTPLMLLLSTNGASDALIDLALESGAVTSITRANRKKHTAADYATMAGRDTLASRISTLAEQEAARTSANRCAMCLELTKPRSRCAHLADSIQRGDAGTHQLVVDFFGANPELIATLGSRLYHRVNCMKNFRKELLEALVMRQALESCAGRVSGCEWDPREWLVVDLCAGKALAASVFGLLYRELRVVAVDQMTEALVADDQHHQHQNVSYKKMDVLSADFVTRLSALVAASGRKHTVVLGMHLCGALSLQAIQAYDLIESVDAIVLCPCCLPSKSAAGSDPAWYASKKQEDQYTAWTNHLICQLGNTAESSKSDELAEMVASGNQTHNHVNDAAAAKNSIITCTKPNQVITKPSQLCSKKAKLNATNVE